MNQPESASRIPSQDLIFLMLTDFVARLPEGQNVFSRE